MTATPQPRQDGAAPAATPAARRGGHPVAALATVARSMARAISKLPATRLALVVLILGLGVTGGVVSQDVREVARARNEQRGARLAHIKATAEAAVGDRVARFQEALRGVQGLFAASKSVERGEWCQYVRALTRTVEFNGVDGMLIITRVTDANREEFLTLTRADDRPDFSITPPPTEKLIPTGEVWVYTHGEPAAVADAVMGKDARTWDGRQAAMEAARDTDMPVLTPILHDVEGASGADVVMYLPIYTNGMPHATLEERRAAHWGWASIRLRTKECLGAGVLHALGEQATIGIFDGRFPAGGADGALEAASQLYNGPSIGASNATDDSTVSTIGVGGRTWTMRIALPADEAHGRFPWILLIGGISDTFMAAWLAWAVARTRDRAVRLATEMTAALRKTTASAQQANVELMFQKAALDYATIVSETDAKGRITYANDNFCAISGYSREELLGQDHRLLNSATHPKAFWKEMFATLDRCGVWRRVVCNRAKDGHLYWVRSTMVVFRDAQGKIARYVSIRTDVTPEVHASRDAVQSERFALATVNAFTAHVSILDERGAIIAVNDSWKDYGRRNGGKGKPASVGVNYLEVCDRAAGKNSEDAGLIAKGIRDVIRGTEPIFSAQYACHSPGEKMWFIVRVTRMPGDGPVRVVVAHENITEVRMVSERLKAQAQDLLRAREVAESANKAKGEFLAHMSHEIRTPLNGVVGMIELVAGSTLTEQQSRYLDLAKTSASSLTTVINDILDFSKMEAGKLELCPTEFDLQSTVEDVVQMQAPRVEQKGLEITCCVEPALPRRLRGDADRLRQVLINLIGNAIKFTKQGSIVIRVVPEEQGEGGPLVRFTISDTGIGIANEKQGRLFQAFMQADSSTTRQHGGTGLGLAICKRIAELMHGSIGVASEEGQGSTFWFTAQFEAVAGAPTRHGDLSSLRMLIVGGSQPQRDLLCTQFIDWQARAEEAEDAEQGLAMLTEAAASGDYFAVAIVSSELGDVGAFELASAVRRLRTLDGTALLLQHPLSSLVDSARAKAAGFAGTLTKPTRQSQLLDTIMSAVGRSSGVPGAESPSELQAMPPASGPAAAGTRRVLVAEDNEINQIVTREILAKAGFECHIVGNGKLAAEAARAEGSSFDLVLMDCQMPEMDGFEATREIRRLEQAALPGGRRLPIIALTANAMKGDRELCLGAGMDAYATKPINPAELLRTIEQVLHARSSTKQAA